MKNALGTIGLCRRAGRLVWGFDAVAEEVKKPKTKVSGVILASDISEKTQKEVRFVCAKAEIPVAVIDVTLDELEPVMGKRTGVIAILDEGFFKTITNNSI